MDTRASKTEEIAAIQCDLVFWKLRLRCDRRLFRQATIQRLLWINQGWGKEYRARSKSRWGGGDLDKP